MQHNLNLEQIKRKKLNLQKQKVSKHKTKHFKQT